MDFTTRTLVSFFTWFFDRTSGSSICPAVPQKKEVSLADLTVSPPSPPNRRSGPRLVCLGNAGYVQGMSDLCAPIYLIMKGKEVMTFWCFAALMERMVRLPKLAY
jgi:hypothetical protein